MYIGLNTAIVGQNNPSLTQIVSSLFSNGEQGVWYDPSDLSTMYQDAAGTIPVTAVEQPVGLVLDKSMGLVLGSERVVNGDFSSGATGWAVSANITITGGQSVWTVTSNSNIYQIGAIEKNKWYKVEYDVTSYTSGNVRFGFFGGAPAFDSTVASVGNRTAYLFSGDNTGFYLAASFSSGFNGSIDNISVRELPGNHAFQSTSASRPVLSARVNQYVGTATLATQNVTTLAATYTLRFEGTGSITLSGTATGTYSAGTHSVVCTAGTLTSTVTGTVTNADIRVTNTGTNLPHYQRVTTATDYDTVSYPFFLRFDGVDDFLVTNSIDFTATDKMTVVTGLRSLSDAVVAAVAFEISPSAPLNSGTFGVFVPDGAYKVMAYFRGTLTAAAATSSATYAAPITSVLTGTGDISGDSAILRINGTQAASSAADQGSGDYGNYPLYIGRRGGTTLPFKGHLYSLIVCGAQSTTAQIVSAETYVNSKTGAY